LLVTSDLAQWHSQAKYDYIIHAASPASPTKYGDAESVWAANVGFIQSASQGQLPGVFLFISSGEVYGPDSPNYVQEDFVGAPAPESSRSVYPAAKLEAERRLLDLGDSDKTKSIVVRLFHSYGPGVRFDDGRSFADILWSGAQGKEIELRSIGSDVRTLMYLEDAAVGILTCLTKGSAQQVYNVGSDRPLSIKEFANEVGRLSNVSVRTKSLADVPLEQIGYVHSPNKSLVPSNNKLRNLGWSEEVTWEDGITRSLDWIRREIEKPRKVALD
jgi:nucleoside-diphosphate-sugar epimerase